MGLINDPDGFHMETQHSHPLSSELVAESMLKCSRQPVYAYLRVPDDFCTASHLSKHKWFTSERFGFAERMRRHPMCGLCVLLGPVPLTLL